ncbi:ABC transporter substrate-binding protein [Acidiphilium sp. AL]|uniref:ABC transporter substrate-binding protein n=1 Tax=Acidiphilium iwatense TaxID=768198 RepID=A0ABS9E335_9PROT|nr:MULTISPECIES: ABC transporter substrate-binding protein [Acidiphilium]MCF3948341.1 ABC transporter substrate-binding protein [Acidiphilium iwatense]MCU4161282.1 ABC transporter substrate-binding protein [Acidiphilium sp. AL]
MSKRVINENSVYANNSTGPEISRRHLLRTAAVGSVGLAATALASPVADAAPAPKRGGNLRLGMTGGSSSDTIAADNTVTQLDTPRIMMLFEPLVSVDRDGVVGNILAESLEPDKTAREWTIRLKKDVVFHNGKKLTAADVAFTFRHIADPKNPLPGATALLPIDLANMKVLDDLTLRVPMKIPYADFPGGMSAPEYFGIVPVGYDPKNPVGTGPFRYKSFTPGQQSVFLRNDNYWRHGLPYLDEVTAIDFATEAAAFNALQGGEIDVFSQAPLSLLSQIQPGGPIKAMLSKPGQWVPFTMRVDRPPFNDPNVRLALKLLVDRPQMLDVSLNGHGMIGNDVFSPWDRGFDKSLVRARDVAHAKHLLRKAGKEDLKIELVTSHIAQGAVRAAQVLAEQAKAAGVHIRLRKVTTDVMYGPNYLKWDFSQDWWNYKPYLAQVAMELLKTSPFNETHWNDAAYTKLYMQAQATLDAAKRYEIMHEMQKIDFETGGLIIPSFNDQVDLMRGTVHGFKPSRTGYSLGNFMFAEAWMS